MLGNKPDDAKIIDAVHAVKSASLSLGFYRLSGLAAAMEHAIRSSDAEAMRANLPLIRQCIFEEFS